jgi:hypothetical protein
MEDFRSSGLPEKRAKCASDQCSGRDSLTKRCRVSVHQGWQIEQYHEPITALGGAAIILSVFS